MARGGKRPGSGRPKGTLNQRTQELVAAAAASGISPLEVMITAMRTAWEAGQINEAVQHAVHAAPYVHPRLAATDLKVDDKRSVREYSTAELEAMLAADEARVAGEEAGASESNPLH